MSELIVVQKSNFWRIGVLKFSAWVIVNDDNLVVWDILISTYVASNMWQVIGSVSWKNN
jgi:hypothetical protein